VTVAKLGRDGVWRIIASGGQVPGNDIDAYMRDVISDVAKAA
jgi:hypothetical protein